MSKLTDERILDEYEWIMETKVPVDKQDDIIRFARAVEAITEKTKSAKLPIADATFAYHDPLTGELFLDGGARMSLSQEVANRVIPLYKKLPDSDFMTLPKKLTSENGAKYALIGEVQFTYEIPCSNNDCDSFCNDCDGSGCTDYSESISWSTIKEIWDKAIQHFEVRGVN